MRGRRGMGYMKERVKKSYQYIQDGNLDEIKAFIKKYPKDIENLYKRAVLCHRNDIAIYLVRELKDEERLEVISRLIIFVAECNNINNIGRLKDLLSELNAQQQREAIEGDNFRVFHVLARNGHIEELQYILSLLPPDKQLEAINSLSYEAVTSARKAGYPATACFLRATAYNAGADKNYMSAMDDAIYVAEAKDNYIDSINKARKQLKPGILASIKRVIFDPSETEWQLIKERVQLKIDKTIIKLNKNVSEEALGNLVICGKATKIEKKLLQVETKNGEDGVNVLFGTIGHFYKAAKQLPKELMYITMGYVCGSAEGVFSSITYDGDKLKMFGKTELPINPLTLLETFAKEEAKVSDEQPVKKVTIGNGITITSRKNLEPEDKDRGGRA